MLIGKTPSNKKCIIAQGPYVHICSSSLLLLKSSMIALGKTVNKTILIFFRIIVAPRNGIIRIPVVGPIRNLRMRIVTCTVSLKRARPFITPSQGYALSLIAQGSFPRLPLSCQTSRFNQELKFIITGSLQCCQAF